jgi:hypothetical protein
MTRALASPRVNDGAHDEDEDELELVSQNEWEGIEAALREAMKRRRVMNRNENEMKGAAIVACSSWRTRRCTTGWSRAGWTRSAGRDRRGWCASASVGLYKWNPVYP